MLPWHVATHGCDVPQAGTATSSALPVCDCSAGGSEVGASAGFFALCNGFMVGKRITSLMLLLSVRSIASRSIPQPQPPVGGNPCSRAVTKPASTPWASPSPASAARACARKHSICRSGSLSSVYALQSSLPQTKSSKRSVRPSSVRCHLASGLMTCGWSTMKVGFTTLSSMKWPHNLSSKRAAVLGSGQSRLCLPTRSSNA
mmetsp:Transcript_62939/g.174458  ORF Transcript_62939/g.174458 Transcript_62939/m.174458 type:complete len:202 (+) Transcript_62939:3-608(+)